MHKHTLQSLDVADAIFNAITDPIAEGSTYELVGYVMCLPLFTCELGWRRQAGGWGVSDSRAKLPLSRVCFGFVLACIPRVLCALQPP